jgi:hypothetical protein
MMAVNFTVETKPRSAREIVRELLDKEGDKRAALHLVDLLFEECKTETITEAINHVKENCELNGIQWPCDCGGE